MAVVALAALLAGAAAPAAAFADTKPGGTTFTSGGDGMTVTTPWSTFTSNADGMTMKTGTSNGDGSSGSFPAELPKLPDFPAFPSFPAFPTMPDLPGRLGLAGSQQAGSGGSSFSQTTITRCEAMGGEAPRCTTTQSGSPQPNGSGTGSNPATAIALFPDWSKLLTLPTVNVTSSVQESTTSG